MRLHHHGDSNMSDALTEPPTDGMSQPDHSDSDNDTILSPSTVRMLRNRAVEEIPSTPVRRRRSRGRVNSGSTRARGSPRTLRERVAGNDESPTLRVGPRRNRGAALVPRFLSILPGGNRDGVLGRTINIATRLGRSLTNPRVIDRDLQTRQSPRSRTTPRAGPRDRGRRAQNSSGLPAPQQVSSTDNNSNAVDGRAESSNMVGVGSLG